MTNQANLRSNLHKIFVVLRPSFSDEGVVNWLFRELPELDDQRPAEVLLHGDEVAIQKVVVVARSYSDRY